MSEVEEEGKFQFLRNGDAEPSELDWSKGIESARQAISEAMNARAPFPLTSRSRGPGISLSTSARLLRFNQLAFQKCRHFRTV